nr:hypothetical protein [Tanacetum cinerariifolium]
MAKESWGEGRVDLARKTGKGTVWVVIAGAGKDDEDDDDNDEEEELAKDDDEETKTGKGGDEVRETKGESEEKEETRQEEEESFDSIPKTPKENLSEMELKKILIEKMEGNKSIQRSDEQRNLYKTLVEAYDAEKDILDTYGDSTILKRRREDDDQEGPSAGSNRGSKRQKEGGEHASASTLSEKATKGAGRSTTGSQSRQMSASESAFVEEPVQTTCQMEETPHPVFETGADDQPIVQTSKHSEWFSQPKRPPSSDHAWNTTLPAAQGDAQSWISDLARQTDARSSFNELLDTPIDFSNFIMHRLNVDTLTHDLLARPTYELMRGSFTSLTELEYHLEEVYKATTDQLDWVNPEGQQGSCTSLTELEYHLEEVYKATTDQLDWVNPEGQQHPHKLLQPLPLIPDNRGRR